MTIVCDAPPAQGRTLPFLRLRPAPVAAVALAAALLVAARWSPELREVLAGLLTAGVVWTAALLLLGAIRPAPRD